MAAAALTSSRKGWRITKGRTHSSSHRGHQVLIDNELPGTPWGAFSHALRDGWQATRPTYNPDSRLWSAWAVPPGSTPVLPVRGFGSTAAAAVLDVAARLGELFGTAG